MLRGQGGGEGQMWLFGGSISPVPDLEPVWRGPSFLPPRGCCSQVPLTGFRAWGHGAGNEGRAGTPGSSDADGSLPAS